MPEASERESRSPDTVVHRRSAKVLDPWLSVLTYLMLAALVAWGIRHAVVLTRPTHLSDNALILIWLGSFLSLALTDIVALFDRPRRSPRALRRAALNELFVTVLIPAYNEDEALLRGLLESCMYQTRKPNQVVVVDDGSSASYESTRAWFLAEGPNHFEVVWERTENAGKRHAQSIGIAHSSAADIYMTVDSDTVLDAKAIYNGLLPFADEQVTSVAGLYIPINANENLLTRVSTVYEMMFQLVDRSVLSVMNSVTVNSGILAFYRAEILRKYMDGYLNETFFGKPVNFSDDSLMTTYCLLEGKTVQQLNSIGFTATPNKLSHHVRRYVRWMRGSFIRAWWRFKYLPMGGFVYWYLIVRWTQFVMTGLLAVYVAGSGALLDPEFIWQLLVVFIGVSYLQALRYLTISRSDETSLQRFLTFLVAPLSFLWLQTILRIVRLYSYATCYKTGWGTRQQVEVGLRVES